MSFYLCLWTCFCDCVKETFIKEALLEDTLTPLPGFNTICWKCNDITNTETEISHSVIYLTYLEVAWDTRKGGEMQMLSISQRS